MDLIGVVSSLSVLVVTVGAAAFSHCEGRATQEGKEEATTHTYVHMYAEFSSFSYDRSILVRMKEENGRMIDADTPCLLLIFCG